MENISSSRISLGTFLASPAQPADQNLSSSQAFFFRNEHARYLAQRYVREYIPTFKCFNHEFSICFSFYFYMVCVYKAKEYASRFNGNNLNFGPNSNKKKMQNPHNRG